jgi:hypothetical protein
MHKSMIYLGSMALVLAIAPSSILGNISQITPISPREKTIAEAIPVRCPNRSSNCYPSLQWQTTMRREGDYYNYFLKSVSYQPQGKILWAIALPERMTSRAIQQSYKKPILHPGAPFLLGILFTPKAIFLADDSGVLVLDQTTGEAIYDKSAEPSPDLFFIDWGSVTLTTSTQRCEAKINGGAFFQECGTYLIYFNGRNLWVWNQSSQLVETTNYSSKNHKIETHRALTYKAKIPLKTVQVEISGFVGE